METVVALSVIIIPIIAVIIGIFIIGNIKWNPPFWFEYWIICGGYVFLCMLAAILPMILLFMFLP